MPSPGHAGEPDLPAPWQIEGWRIFQADNSQNSTTHLAVDFGSKNIPADQKATITVLGSQGTAHGFLIETVRSCHYLCGEEGDGECHYTGLYQLDKTPEQLGVAWTALPGKHEISAFGKTSPVPSDLPKPGDETPLVWDGPSAPMEIHTYKIKSSENARLSLELDTGGIEGPPVPVEGSACKAQAVTPLTSVTCDGYAAFFEGSSPLLLSWPDYNTPKADFLATFTHGDKKYFVLRLGLKAQDVVGLLVKTKDGWRFLVVPRDYASLC